MPVAKLLPMFVDHSAVDRALVVGDNDEGVVSPQRIRWARLVQLRILWPALT